MEREALINLRPGAMSPMNASIDYSRFASSLVMNAASPPVTRVSECGMFITYGEHTLSVVKWREGLRKLANEITQELDDLCLNQTFDLVVPTTIPDDWGNEERGYSWTKNETFLPDKRILLAAMLANPELKLANLNDAGQLIFDHAAIWKFIFKCNSVNEKLSLLSFFTPGQTPRVSEFVEHKYANSTKPRTMFKDFKSLWLATRRVKSTSIMEKETFLPIKCHPELTALLERYLLIVRPVEAEMVKIVKGEKQYHVYKEYLWTKDGERVSAEQMRASILKFNTNYCDVAVGTKEYRQICVQMNRTFLGSENEIKEEEMDALAAQASHSIIITRLRYAPEVGKLPSMSSDLLLRFGRVSEAWWEHTGFKPGCPPLLPLRARQELRDAALAAKLHPPPAPLAVVDTQAIVHAVTLAVITEVQKMQGNLDAQIRRSIAEALAEVKHPNIGQPNHTPLSSQPPLAFNEDVDMDSRGDGEEESSSLQEHPPLPPMTDIYGHGDPIEHFSEHEDTPPSVPLLAPHRYDPVTNTEPAYEAVSDETSDTWLTLHSPGLSSASFKSPYQKEAVRLTVERRHSFIAILPAGENQSLVYTLPAAFDRNKKKSPSYIIAPRSANLKDQSKDVRRLGIKSKQWSVKNMKVNEERLVFWTIENASSTKFEEYVLSLHLPVKSYCLIDWMGLGIGRNMGRMLLVGSWSMQILSSQIQSFIIFLIMMCPCPSPMCKGFSSWKLFRSGYRHAF